MWKERTIVVLDSFFCVLHLAVGREVYANASEMARAQAEAVCGGWAAAENKIQETK